MNTKIAVTVVIPAYNRAHTIERCLKSVLSQSYPPAEIIVVDDASTDRTRERVLAVSDQRIRCIRLAQNSGAQAARNEGVRQARYDWIAFQDSDDEWLPDRLRLCVEALTEMQFQSDAVIHGDCLVFKEPTGSGHLWTLPLVEGATGYRAVLSNPGPMFQALFVSKRQLHNCGYLDEQVPSYQEWDTAILLAKRCRFRHIRTPLFIYHIHQGETISKNMMRDIRGYEYIIRKHEQEIRSVCGLDVWERHLRYQLHRALIYRCWDIATRCLNDLEQSRCAVHPALKVMVRLRIGSRHVVHAGRVYRWFRKSAK